VPTVIKQSGFEVAVRPNDHEPPHVHVFKGDGQVKINLDPVEVVQAWNMKKQEARNARTIVEENRELLLERWREFHA
jgi:hypothetical protein